MRVHINELFKGVAVVIDDEVNDVGANIQKIIEQISALHIPFVKYTDIPSEDEVTHFQSLSFILLDWRLIKPDLSTSDLTEGVSITSELEEDNINRNIDFIKRLYEVCYCPVFIFTNENENDIMGKLITENICASNRPSNILIRQKSSLQKKGSLQRTLEKWLKTNPSVYLLKEWEREYQLCKNSLFFDFQQMSPVWPQVMWRCFDKDGANKSLELGDLISRNLHTRMKPFEFNEDLFKSTAKEDQGELRKVLEGALFLKKESLHDDNIAPGDLFYFSSNYYVNIRAACDLIPDRNDPCSVVDNVELYLLKGAKLSDKKTKELFAKKYGHFNETEVQSVIFPLHGGKAIDFRFKLIITKKWQDVKDKRIGRILPPYITKIQQRFALYLHRQGLPRVPSEAVF